MGSGLANVRVAFVVANDGIEEAELVQPWHSVLVDAGARAELVAIGGRPGPDGPPSRPPVTRFPVDRTTEEARVGDFDGVVLPGGVIDGDRDRGDAAAVDFLVAMVESGKPVGALCHGLCPLIDGDLRVCGRTVTSGAGDADRPPQRWRLLGRPRGRAAATRAWNTLVTSPRARRIWDAFCRELTTTLAATGGAP